MNIDGIIPTLFVGRALRTFVYEGKEGEKIVEHNYKKKKNILS